MKIPIKYIIEIGLLRKRGKCANCKKKIDVECPNIQLCKKCRKVSLRSISDYILKGSPNPKSKNTKNTTEEKND